MNSWVSSRQLTMSRALGRASTLWNVVGFHEGYAGRPVYAANDGGVVGRRQCGDYDRFAIVARRKAGGLHFRLVFLPVVVRFHEHAVLVVQLQHWVEQRIGHAGRRERRSDGPDGEMS